MPPRALPPSAREVSTVRGNKQKREKKEKKTNDIKITKHAQCYYTSIDLFLKHTLALKSRLKRLEMA